MYNPSNWYWLADDGRIFSSDRCALVQESDSAYQTWLRTNTPTRWPLDAHDAQTIAALQDVLSPYGLYADLKTYAASVRYAKETGGVTIAGIQYPSDRETQAKMTAAVVFGQVQPSITFQWKVANGSFVELDAAGITAVAAQVGAHVQASFATESDVVSAIDAGTITTKGQVDEAFS
ncbi:DUF4376 domain-containing protein [Bradyrhizobium cenepequi]